MTKKEHGWYPATLISSTMVAADVKSLTFKPSQWKLPKPGQHYEIRLTAPDGYQAARPYSLASAPEQTNELEFGIQLLPNGEVSPYLFQLKEGEQVELKGPLGGHFIWEHTMPGPLLLIGGGSGLVPLISMLRHSLKHNYQDPIYFLISTKTEDKILYWPELQQLARKNKNLKIIPTLTGQIPQNWKGETGRIDNTFLSKHLSNLKDKMPLIYICGPTPFVESIASSLQQFGFNPHEIRTERFGG
ncbi:MAG TPA: FAD-binding oxidoreductase [Candidatus Nanoarchaeia archaeon]|nr:FAD-binding oxidoreductase [Candidatus Nanoarchaeia archaeon]